MLARLLKYDFRSMLKQFAFLWPAALLLAFINHFTLAGFSYIGSIGKTAAGILMTVYIVILVAMFIIAVVFVIQRFYKGLLGDEGYLMHTLPVRPWQLIFSKLLCAVVLTTVSVLVAIISMFLLIPIDFRDLLDFFRYLREILFNFRVEIFNSAAAIAEIIFYMIVSFTTGYLQLYFAMSIGHLFNKNRVAMSVVAYLVTNTVMSAIGYPIIRIFSSAFTAAIDAMPDLQSYHLAIWLGILRMVLVSAVYFIGTEYILRKKLNLE